MAPKMLLLLLAAVLLGGGATPAAAFDEPYVFPPTAPEAYPMERSTYRSWRELVALLASNTSLGPGKKKLVCVTPASAVYLTVANPARRPRTRRALASTTSGGTILSSLPATSSTSYPRSPV